ncbi:hypothetical protein SeMB42_g05658 [Synchytrium endobioticum]|uniref:Regulator of chromosome condensation 1/beta-lactamase-inhibitor protein II n=1 Tax=Synchytrium endobioticum TaxID=286115 RepID=A0A507CQ08_9FUNG|nr:hypothetical protein SeMB42_g05658 [Synchytrium endobioticum]
MRLMLRQTKFNCIQRRSGPIHANTNQRLFILHPSNAIQILPPAIPTRRVPAASAATVVAEVDVSSIIKRNGCRIVHVAAGYAHCAIAWTSARDGHGGLVTLGAGHCGQLGIGPTSSSISHGIVPLSQDLTIKHAACGRLHTIVAATRNSREYLFGFGHNHFGQLGLLTTSPHILYPTQIPWPASHGRVHTIACGLDHTIILTENGSIYTAGFGADGQTGTSSSSDARAFTPIAIPRMTNITTSADANVAWNSQSGEVYVWGNSEYAQLMHGTKVDRVLAPEKCPSIPSPPSQIASGGTFTFLNVKNQLYMSGLAAFNEALGIDAHVATPTPVKNDIVEIDHTTQLHASTHHAAIVTGGRTLHSLGLGTNRLETFTFDGTITKVALGGNFALLVTDA